MSSTREKVRHILLKCVMTLSALVLGNGKATLAEAVIQVGVYQNRPKVFIDEAGNPAGFFPALLSEIAGPENLTLQYVPCSWKSCLSALETGSLDLMVDVAYSPQREQRFDFNTEVVFMARSFLYTAAGVDVKDWADLNQKRVAVLNGSIQEQWLRDRAQALDFTPIWIEVSNFKDLFEQLNRGTVEVGVANEFLGERLAPTYPDVQRSDILLETSAIHFATPKGKNQRLLTLLDRQLVQLKDTPNSAYHEALQRWLLQGERSQLNSPWVAQLMTSLLIMSTISIIGIILFTNRRLKQELRKRQQVETDLKDREMQFKALVQNVPGALFRYVQYADGSDKILHMSSVCEQLWEVKASEVEASAKILWEMVHPDDLEAMQASMKLSAATLQPWFFEWRIITPSGKTKWLQGRGNPTGENQATIAWDTVIIEVTEQKLMEQALEESEQKLQEITNAVPGAVYQYQLDGNGNERFLFMSAGLQQLLGLSPEAVMINPGLMWERMDQQTRSRLKLFLEYSAATLSPWQCEFEVTLPEGEKKWIKGESVPKQIADGIIWNGILVDISQQKWQERLLGTQQEILEDLAEGNELDSICTELVHLIEQQTQGLMGSILLLEGKQLWHCGQSQLPTPYLAAIDGLEIGEGVGSCGHAAACGEPVIVTNIQTDPLWENYRELAQTHNLQSCWSMPIFSSSREVLGTFALYSQTPRHPTADERQLIEIATKVAALAIERKQQESKLQEKAEQEQLLTQVATRIRQSLDLKTVLDQTVQEIRAYLETDRVLIYRITGKSTKVIAESVGEQWYSLLNQEFNDLYLRSEYDLSQFDQGYIQNIPNVNAADLDPAHQKLLQQQQVQAHVVLGILQEEGVWGFLIAQHCRDQRQWQASEIRFLQRLCEQVAIAIQQSELYEKVNVELLEKGQLASQLHFQAMHDALTQLPNRSLLMDRLQHTFQVYRRRDRDQYAHFALLFLDLNRFKLINDTLGHEAGDELLVTVAERLEGCLRAMDTVARLGGDEFVVIIEQITGEKAAVEIANRIHRAFTPPAYLNGQAVQISTSIGIVLHHSDYNYPEEMLRDADIAMYEAKRNHLKYVVFHSSMQVSVSESVQLEADLRKALEKQQFTLQYQPIIHLIHETIQGFEAFIAWQHPTRGLLSPSTFMPIAEQANLTQDLELWVIQTACLQLKQWQADFSSLAAASMHINLSHSQLAVENFVPLLQEQLETMGLDPSHLKLELTEQELIENQDLARKVLRGLDNLGVKICLDHFGGIYSSLSHLSQFPIHEIKLDPSLIVNLRLQEKRHQQILKAIRSLSHSLKIDLITEGVETADQTEILKRCDYQIAQGAYFSQPLSAAEMTAFLAQ